MKKYTFILMVILFSGLFVYGQNDVTRIIKQKIDEGTASGSISVKGITLFAKDVLPEFYEKNNYAPAWNEPGRRDELIKILMSARDEGLTPADYHLEIINQLTDGQVSNNDPVLNAELDLLMTDAILHYASDLLIGKVDQSKIREGWDVPPNRLPGDGPQRLEDALNSNTLTEAIDNLKPDNFMYTGLKNGLAHYYQIAENGGWPKVNTDKVLKPGMMDTAVITLRKYLTITGDLPRNNYSSNDTVYDSVVVDAVKQFQFRHNLTQDGIIGKETLLNMNVPVEDRINQIRVNLERARWVMHVLENDFLVANIAGYNLRRVTNDSVVFYSRVIVGRKYHESPIFKGKLQYIVLNPTWTLPYSIATKETLPKLQKDPGYLAKHNMIIMDRSGKVLDPSTIDFNRLSRGNFPYIVRQEAGPHNSLGQVKFIFPNSYSVYIHDTPARSLFSREKRAFSHGCIRLDDKWGLFLNLMNDSTWNMERINKILDSGETTRINLKKPIDILLLYWTAGADKQNRLYFDEDVYNRDPAVLQQLDLRYE